MGYIEMSEIQKTKRDNTAEPWYQMLCNIVGDENILAGFADRLAYGRDRWPIANLTYRFGHFPKTAPSLVVIPRTYEEVSEVLKIANEYKLAIIPYGFGSGVCGGTIPLANEIIIDLKCLNHIVDIDTISGLATVQAGMNGELFEAELNKRKFTLGHFPQSLNTSTIGGWVACRSAGQASSRYGKIEDMVVGLKAALPDGRFVDVRPVPRRSVGPSIKDIFVGSEGTMGIILEATFRVIPYPERETIHVFGFSNYEAGLQALRKIMQAELRPSIVRLYDEHESRSRIKEFPEYKNHPCISMLAFNGLKELVEVEERLSQRICQDMGGIEGDPEPAYKWLQHRFESLSPKPISEGRMLDTIEIAASWTNLPVIYREMKSAILAVNSNASVGAHWSHVYSDGACMYMTFVIQAPDENKAALENKRVWEGCMKACLDAGGTMSHHHGIGYLRAPWIAEELGTGYELLKNLKRVIDPNYIMNPGKLSL